MKSEPGIFDEADPEAETASLARALEDVRCGRVVPHEEVVKWLKTWGTSDEHPAPREWFE